MIKSEIRSLILNLLPKYDEHAEFHPRFLDALIEKVLAEFYNMVFLRSPLELERYTKQFGYTAAIPLVLEAATGLYYATYPTGISIIPIPDKASGVRRVSTPTQGGTGFYPMDAREMDLIMSGSYADTVTSKIGYVPRRTRIEFYNPTIAVIASGVRLDLLIPFSNYLDSDTVLVPEITNQEGKGFTDRMLEVLSIIRPVDLLENKNFEEVKQGGQR